MRNFLQHHSLRWMLLLLNSYVIQHAFFLILRQLKTCSTGKIRRNPKTGQNNQSDDVRDHSGCRLMLIPTFIKTWKATCHNKKYPPIKSYNVYLAMMLDNRPDTSNVNYLNFNYILTLLLQLKSLLPLKLRLSHKFWFCVFVVTKHLNFLLNPLVHSFIYSLYSTFTWYRSTRKCNH